MFYSKHEMLLKIQVLDDDPLGMTEFVDFLRLRMNSEDVARTYRSNGYQFTIRGRTE